jgi:hypothetical protein
VQCLRLQIPKRKKTLCTDGLIVFFVHLGYAWVKATCEMLVKSTLGNFLKTFPEDVTKIGDLTDAPEGLRHLAIAFN